MQGALFLGKCLGGNCLGRNFMLGNCSRLIAQLVKVRRIIILRENFTRVIAWEGEGCITGGIIQE